VSRLLAALALVHALTASAAPCDLLHTTCNTVAGKLPSVTKVLPTGPTFETGLTAAEKVHFEHMFGHALRQTKAVQWATGIIGSRLHKFVVSGASRVGLREKLH
jgi:hypothetical protein